MQKKPILLLSIVLCMSVIGCSQSSDTPNSEPVTDNIPTNLSYEEIFNQVMSEASDPTSAHLKMYSQSEMISSDTSTLINAEHEIKYDMREENNTKYHSISSSNSPMLEQVGVIETYYLDGYFYTSYGDNKMKSKVDEGVIFPQVDYSSVQFKAEELLDFTFEEKEEFNIFTYSIKEENLPQHIEEIEQMHGIADGIEFIDASGETVISKDGKILQSDITIEVEIDSPALSATILTDTFTEYYSINGDVNITPPQDLQSFIEY